jgi:hypothetical protein
MYTQGNEDEGSELIFFAHSLLLVTLLSLFGRVLRRLVVLRLTVPDVEVPLESSSLATTMLVRNHQSLFQFKQFMLTKTSGNVLGSFPDNVLPAIGRRFF